MNTQHCIEVCNKLLRGERSAVEAYTKAIMTFEKEYAVPNSLLAIRDDHKVAVSMLTENVRSMGGAPSTDTGAWGAFTSFVQGTADLLGGKSAVASLRAGETAGKMDYEAAMEDEEVMSSCKEMIRNELLPTTERHIGALETLTA
ncbi:hypothetical protein TSACC_21748 [Terrimicrobium sacchariphilum]|uniref:DUF2383 domain-containing protein n=1 Tax=Terrimicrobium sacchariphilum TaxID=690879 RepID=A0A146G7K5_TERSA|nr:DUF2383 domain-containing protein [Terrimicrobium sacchariphilum]GAT33333.1 hypothetical protein TSACC_21748 [Terrimicrobium sacchariphilum]